MIGSKLKTGNIDAPVGVAVRVTKVCDGSSTSTGTV